MTGIGEFRLTMLFFWVVAPKPIASVKEKFHINVLNSNHVDGNKSTIIGHFVCNCGVLRRESRNLRRQER